jgi:hypothetical protein
MSFLPGYAYRMKGTIDSGDVSATLTWFPVLVSFGLHEKHIFEIVGSDYTKLAFTKADGKTRLYAEVVGWNESAKTCEIWVSRDGWTISSSADTEFYVYYDKELTDSVFIGVTGSDAGEKVWDDNFKLVCHMDDNPDTSSVMDSTSNDNDGTKSDGAGIPAETTGKIGKGQDFVGVNADITQGASPTLDFPTGDFSLECWVYDTISGHHIFVMRGAWLNGYVFAATNETTIYMELNDGAERKVSWNVASILNAWKHLVVTVDRTANLAELFINNVSQGTKDISGTAGSITSAGNNWIGAYQGWAFDIEDEMDEVRIYDDNYSDAWVGASYENQRVDFVVYGNPSHILRPQIGGRTRHKKITERKLTFVEKHTELLTHLKEYLEIKQQRAQFCLKQAESEPLLEKFVYKLEEETDEPQTMLPPMVVTDPLETELAQLEQDLLPLVIKRLKQEIDEQA